MATKVVCDCGQRLSVPDGTVARDLRCPRCGKLVATPTLRPVEYVDDLARPVREFFETVAALERLILRAFLYLVLFWGSAVAVGAPDPWVSRTGLVVTAICLAG